MISFDEKKFNDLSPKTLHDIFALRSEVFVLEQHCIYQDIDGKDIEAIHIIGKEKRGIVAYARILNTKKTTPNVISIGRIVISKRKRGKGYGHKLVDFCLDVIKKREIKRTIKISAQEHLKEFYEHHGIIIRGVGYLEDGIPHIEMIIKN